MKKLFAFIFFVLVVAGAAAAWVYYAARQP
jgi:hypothetical protein